MKGSTGLRALNTTAPWLVLALLVACPAFAIGDLQRGKQLFALAAGCGCHTAEQGPVGAGGGEVPTPFGTFYGSNITPDRQTGIGAWSDEEIATAIRGGYARGKGVESPAMPYYQYAGMADRDVEDLIAYLRSLTPVEQANLPHRGELPLARLAYRAWRLLFAEPVQPLKEAPAAGVERGAYLVHHVSICVDCHTPRSRFGAPIAAMHLAGSAHGPAGKAVPNITPHATGIGDWDEADIFTLLTQAMKPDFDNVQGLMADVIDGHGGGPGYKHASEADRRAIAAYLRSVSAIDNPVTDK
jgi:mono/diheme cytochrome c family protein